MNARNPNVQYHNFLKAYQDKQKEVFKELHDVVLMPSLALKDTDKGKHFITPEGLESYKISAVEVLRGFK